MKCGIIARVFKDESVLRVSECVRRDDFEKDKIRRQESFFIGTSIYFGSNRILVV